MLVEKNKKTKNKKQSEDNTIKNVRNLFRLKKEKKEMKHRIIRDFKNLLEQQKDYDKPVRAGKFYRNNYIENESNSDTKKTLSIKEYLD